MGRVVFNVVTLTATVSLAKLLNHVTINIFIFRFILEILWTELL
jgi:hypothetical protein